MTRRKKRERVRQSQFVERDKEQKKKKKRIDKERKDTSKVDKQFVSCVLLLIVSHTSNANCTSQTDRSDYGVREEQKPEGGRV